MTKGRGSGLLDLLQIDHIEVIQVLSSWLFRQNILSVSVVTPDGSPDHLRAQGSAWVQVTLTIYTIIHVCAVFPLKCGHGTRKAQSSEVNRGFVS